MTTARIALHMFVAYCPDCGGPVYRSTDRSGESIECPGCMGFVMLPQMRQFGEEDWPTCENPQLALVYLTFRHLDHLLSNRRRRLLGCAVCRHHWTCLPDKRCRHGVDVAEKFADTLVGVTELFEAHADVSLVVAELRRQESVTDDLRWACRVQEVLEVGAPFGESLLQPPTALTSCPADCIRLREIVGNPFRPVPLDPAWLTWNRGTVRRLAETIYETRAFESLPILADALEDAGCTDAALLDHLRGPEPHALGCFALDLVLGKS
jgi:hypothetical protein